MKDHFSGRSKMLQYPSLVFFSLFLTKSAVLAASLKSNPETRHHIENIYLKADRCLRQLDKEKKPVVLVIGPTRSGKSTLIYELLGGEWEGVGLDAENIEKRKYSNAPRKRIIKLKPREKKIHSKDLEL